MLERKLMEIFGPYDAHVALWLSAGIMFIHIVVILLGTRIPSRIRQESKNSGGQNAQKGLLAQ
jgi:hypothetical protein